jgi:uncharacterized lipoprotein YmbA
MTTLRRRHGLAIILAALAGCTSPDPILYTLRPVPGEVQHGRGRIVLLRRPGLPRYLDRTSIITEMPGYRVETASGDRWAEPIGGMFTRVLVQDLNQRLPDCTVIGEQGALSLSPDVSIDLEVQDFGPDGNGSVVLQAQLGIERSGRNHGPQVRAVRFSVRPTSPGTAGVVAAMSDVLGQLADTIATWVGA